MSVSANRALREINDVPRHVNWHLSYGEEILQHRCPFCMAGLFRSQYRVVSIKDNKTGEYNNYLLPPISFQCHKCGTIYHIQIISDR